MAEPQCATRQGARAGTRINTSTAVVCAPEHSDPSQLMHRLGEVFAAAPGSSWRFWCALSCPTFSAHWHFMFTQVALGAETPPAQSTPPAPSESHQACASNANTFRVHIHGSKTRAIACVPHNTLDAQAAHMVEVLSPAGAGQAWKFDNVCNCPTYPSGSGKHIHYSFVKEPTQEGTPMSTMYCSKDSTHSRVEKLPGRAVLMCTDLTPAQALVHVARGFPNLTRGHDWVIVSTEQCPSHATHKHFLMAARAKTESAAIAGCYDAPPPSVWDEESPPEMQPMQGLVQQVPDAAPDLDKAEPLPTAMMSLVEGIKETAESLSTTTSRTQRVDDAVRMLTCAQLLMIHTMRDVLSVHVPKSLERLDPKDDAALQFTALAQGGKEWPRMTPEQCEASPSWTLQLVAMVEERNPKKRVDWRKIDKIPCIKIAREITGWGLKESKAFLEKHVPQLNLD